MTATSTRETVPLPRRRNGRLALKFAAVSAALMTIWAMAGFFLFVSPQADNPTRADVLFVLGPPDHRMDYAEKLMQQGYAPTLAISMPLSEDGKYDEDICNAPRPYRIVCFHPDPFTTQGEARALAEMSNKYGWRSADVLTARFHVSRARVILDRCYKGDLHMIADQRHMPLISVTNGTDSWLHEYVYQSAAFIKVALNQGC